MWLWRLLHYYRLWRSAWYALCEDVQSMHMFNFKYYYITIGACTQSTTAPPSNVYTLNGSSLSHDSTDSSAILLTWTVLPLDQTKGFVTLTITFGPLGGFANERAVRRKRQTSTNAEPPCIQSPCQIPYEQGRVRITGLDSQRSYFIVVVHRNEEGEIGTGTPTALGVPAMTEQQSRKWLASTLSAEIEWVFCVIIINIILFSCIYQ